MICEECGKDIGMPTDREFTQGGGVACTKCRRSSWTIGESEWKDTPAGGYRFLQITNKDYLVALVQVDEDDDEQMAYANMIVLSPQLIAFVRTTARLLKDGELDDEGEQFDLTNDDAVDTLHSLIREARDLHDTFSQSNTKRTA